MKSGTPRVVFDCNVLLQAFLNNGPAYRCLERIEWGRAELLVSPATMEEARDVFSRPELMRKYPQLTPRRVTTFLNVIARKATLIENVSHGIDFPRDRKDEPYLDLAWAGQGEYLVTRDKDLLAFSQEQTSEAAIFRKLCPNLRIMDPPAFLKELEVHQQRRTD